jgi:ATP-dependent Clp protease protease subunit
LRFDEGEAVNLTPVEIPSRPKGLRFQFEALAEPQFDVKAEAATISVFDVIGLEVTASRVAGALRSIGDRPVTVQINSPGGDPFVGLAIYNLLRGHSKPVTVQVIGIAASAASIVAMGGERIEMARAAQIMIHRASGGAVGDGDTMRAMATALDKVDSVLAGVYEARTGLPRSEIVAMMEAETFLASEDAVSLGFADALLARDASPVPRLAASAAPRSKREWEEHFRHLGLGRFEAARNAAAVWRSDGVSTDPEIDLEKVAAAVTRSFSAFNL